MWHWEQELTETFDFFTNKKDSMASDQVHNCLDICSSSLIPYCSMTVGGGAIQSMSRILCCRTTNQMILCRCR